MSQDVTPAAFERQRSALLHLLDQVEVAESNCPRGARVAVVAYSAHTKYLIRFQDYRRKTQLLNSVKNIALERTSNRRQLGGAMRFVGNHVFKRVRAGMLVRKVAVFLVGGPTQDVDEVLTATMEYRGLDIIPAIISLRNTAAIGRALEVRPHFGGVRVFTRKKSPNMVKHLERLVFYPVFGLVSSLISSLVLCLISCLVPIRSPV